MRVGVYVDGYNLYYGGRSQCGRSTPGWRWFSPRDISECSLRGQLAYAQQQGWENLVAQWSSASISRVVYCTARVDATQNPSAHRDQDIYLKALVAAQAVDHIEYGNYVARVKQAPLATKDPKTRKPVVTTADWPVMVKDNNRTDVRGATFLVSYLHNEEKGSDVNVATHLLREVLSHEVDAAIVISNDSDLRLPIEEAKKLVPVGIINPGKGPTAGDLRCGPDNGTRFHWNRRLSASDFKRSQMPNQVGKYTKPQGW